MAIVSIHAAELPQPGCLPGISEAPSVADIMRRPYRELHTPSEASRSICSPDSWPAKTRMSLILPVK